VIGRLQIITMWSNGHFQMIRSGIPTVRQSSAAVHLRLMDPVVVELISKAPLPSPAASFQLWRTSCLVIKGSGHIRWFDTPDGAVTWGTGVIGGFNRGHPHQATQLEVIGLWLV